MTARSAEQDTGFRRRSFEFYLRTGLQLIPPAEELEQKFNPYHDPYNGRFTFAPGGSLRAAATGGARPQPKLPLGTAPNSPRSQGGRRNLDALSKQFETAAGNPGTVSTGEGDSGGVSYGSYQLSSKRGAAAEFVAGEEARPWATAFRGLTPGSDEFSAQWRAIAGRDPAAFGAAQRAYIIRIYYDGAVTKVARSTGFDLDAASEALRQVTYSTAVQHGASGGAQIITAAIKRAGMTTPRTAVAYQRVLIVNIYQGRISNYLAASERYLKLRNPKKHSFYRNIATIRFVQERQLALEKLELQ